MRYLGWRSVLWPVVAAFLLGELSVSWRGGVATVVLIALGGALGWWLASYPDREP